jgi:hypothetical protein
MPRPRALPFAPWGLAAVVAVMFAYAWTMHPGAPGELSNYALVRALADGTPTIDRTRFEVGDLAAGDFRTHHGHVYSDKAPGLAFVTVPAYVVLRALGLRTSGDPTVALWALRLWSIVLPAALLLLLTARLAESISPGFGAATAVALGTGTLILTFANSFYSHALSAALVFASFALLWKEREGRPRLGLVAAAGLLVGFAVTCEYQTGLAAAVFGAYAIVRAPRLTRGAAYGVGVIAGVTPLLVYNRWAFGSVTHLSYFGDELESGTFSSWLQPSLINGLYTFVSMPGLLVLAPVLACGIVGLGLLFAAGKRAEALVIGLVAAAFTIYNTTLPGVEYDAFLAGPRYLVPVIPLLALPVALTFRRWPLTTVGLGLVSTTLLGVMTVSNVAAGTEPRWFHALAERNFPSTAASLVGVTGWYAIVPYFVAMIGAAVFAALAISGGGPGPRDAVVAGLAIVAWAGVAAFAPSTITGRATSYSAYIPAVLIVTLAASAAAFTRLQREPVRLGDVDGAPSTPASLGGGR